MPNVEAILSRLPAGQPRCERADSMETMRDDGGTRCSRHSPDATDENMRGASPTKKDDTPIANDWKSRVLMPIVTGRMELEVARGGPRLL